MTIDRYIPDAHKPFAKPINQIYADACEELLTPFPSVQLLTFQTLNRITGGFRPYEFSILCGQTGCLGGETLIRINRAGKGFSIPIRDLYLRTRGLAVNQNFNSEIPTFVRSFDGIGTRLHKLKDVHLSGVKETWEFKFGSSKRIRATPSHRFLTERGWVPGCELTHGDRVATERVYTRRTVTERKRFRDNYYSGVKFHPFASNCNNDKRIVYHRAAYEANANGLSLSEFLSICRKDEDRAKTLVFVDPKKYHIHHTNHDHSDNRPENLELLDVKAHLLLHGDSKNFGAGTVQWVPFLSSGKIGVESVYDIECEDPFHNFSAQDLIVHNSGKTTLCANLSREFLLQGIPHFVASVETGHTDYVKRIISSLAERDWNTGDAVPINHLKEFHSRSGRHFESDKFWLSLYDNRIKIETLLADMAYMVKHHGAKIAIIDNLNFFMEVTRAEDSIVEMDRVIHELVIFAKQVPLHVLMVMHPKKTDSGRVESEYDIKGSSVSCQEAHNIFGFNRPHPELLKSGNVSPRDRELKIIKMRRKGKFVGHRLILTSTDGVSYSEGDLYDFSLASTH